jgi:hypothetical protein
MAFAATFWTYDSYSFNSATTGKKIKLSLCLSNSEPRHKNVRAWRYSSIILDLCTRWTAPRTVALQTRIKLLWAVFNQRQPFLNISCTLCFIFLYSVVNTFWPICRSVNYRLLVERSQSTRMPAYYRRKQSYSNIIKISVTFVGWLNVSLKDAECSYAVHIRATNSV